MTETKDEAESRKARAEADQAEAEAREFGSPSAQALREAERRQKLLTAERETVSAQAGLYSSLVPDLSSVSSGTTVSGTTALFESTVLASALDDACRAVVVDVQAERKLTTVLVTTEADLIASDDAYRRVDAAISELDAAAKPLLPEPPVTVGGIVPFALPVLPGLGLVSAALPTVMSLLAKTHTVTSSPGTPQVAVASTMVCKHLLGLAKGATVVHDMFRVLGDGPLDSRMGVLAKTRTALQEVALQEVALHAPESDDPNRRAAAGALVARIDAFVGAITATTGSARSVLALARSRQVLHGPGPVHVLLLHDPSATVSQVVETKFRGDTYRVVGTANVSWLLLRSDREGLVAAGMGTGLAAEGGKIENIKKL